MFSFLKSERSKLRETAKNWIYVAKKVYHFRKDRMSDSESQRLLKLIEEVKAGMRQREDERLKTSVADLKHHLEQVGGNYYPRSSMAENVEFFLAAIIIYVGVTTFFVKPFKIPTNSMWPTYHGMTGEVYTEESAEPNLAEKAFRFVAFGAKHFDVEAPISGELLVPMVRAGGGYRLAERGVNAKRYFVLNTPGLEYSFYVDSERVSFKFPADFDYSRQVIAKLREAEAETPYDLLPSRNVPSSRIAGEFRGPVYDRSRKRNVEATIYLIRTGRQVEEGENIVSFDLMTGDQLFVDRMSYHFVEPKVGDGFVFKTGEIPDLAGDQFYIKRLAGTPGDTVEIKGQGLFVNGEPADGSVAFEKNAEGIEPYQGYTYDPPGRGGRLAVDLSEPQTVPPGSFLALGDNSYNSYDGRGWGYVPESSVVGRPIMIYYPFTQRFGLAE